MSRPVPVAVAQLGIVRPMPALVLLALLCTSAVCGAKELRGSKARDGSTEEKAIINPENCIDEAVDMDWRYMVLHFPTMQPNDWNHSTIVGKKAHTAFSHYEFFTADGRKRDLWFDISAAFFTDQKTIHCKSSEKSHK
jgi:hypothetical protein